MNVVLLCAMAWLRGIDVNTHRGTTQVLPLVCSLKRSTRGHVMEEIVNLLRTLLREEEDAENAVHCFRCSSYQHTHTHTHTHTRVHTCGQSERSSLVCTHTPHTHKRTAPVRATPHIRTQTRAHTPHHVTHMSARKHSRPCVYTRRCVVADMPPAVRAEFKEVKDLEQQKRKTDSERVSKDAVS
jgi:hypothetical protein